MERLHKEITCPYCRMGFGEYKIKEDTLFHLSYGLEEQCEQSEYIKQFIKNKEDEIVLSFEQDFKVKLSILRNKFLNNPEDFDKSNCTALQFMDGFKECMLYGYVDKLGECYDKQRMKETPEQEWISLYNSGVSIKEALEKFIVKKN